ncbi:MAG: DUF1850 domain-containing protein [Paracoccus sp. (in: a-proteobacteria)]|nr:DUF1850 domain-containing protein [Paracoccus sp. (in: a-proteobacteria)]
MPTKDRPGRAFAVALGLGLGMAQGAAAWQVDLPAPRLEVVMEGERLAALAMPQGARICLHWFHSVTGGAVADCFENRAGRLTLAASFLHDYAAGLGEIPGRGQPRAVAGGYLIDQIDETLPGNRLSLRVAAPHVAQELRGAAGVVPIWRLAPHASRINLVLVDETHRQSVTQDR